MWPERFVSATDYLGIGHTDAPASALSGGVLGQFLAAPATEILPAGVVRRYIGTVGSAIVGIVFLLSGLIFIWFADWQTVFAETFRNDRSSEKKTETPPVPVPAPKASERENGPSLRQKLFEKLRLPRKSDDIVDLPPVTESYSLIDEDEDGPMESPELELVPSTTTALPQPVPERIPAPAPPKSHHAPSFELDAPYLLPTMPLLEKVEEKVGQGTEFVENAKSILQSTLESFNVNGQVTGTVSGPRVTRFEVSLAPGVKVDRVVQIEKNIAMELEAESIRILAPIPGKNAVGVEIPNSSPSAVFLRSIMELPAWTGAKAEIPIVLGKDVAGNAVILDLAKAPHLLIAGATGAGKSVCMNTLIMSLLFRFSPQDLKMIMVDPKIVEMKMYEALPHLITPVVNDPAKVPFALRWGVNEMEKRYQMMAIVKAKNLKTFNTRPVEPDPLFDPAGNEIPPRMPYIIIIIDELADVMMSDAKADVETSIARIAQKGRAAGIHIVIATQRPSVNIITGVIKANLPTRIAFRVGSFTDSRVILDQKGAEKLLGSGDMLFIPPGASNLERIQGAFVKDQDIQKVVDFVSAQASQNLDESIVSGDDATVADDEIPDSDWDSEISESELAMVNKYLQPGDDELTRKSLEIILTERKASTSYLQRRLKIGYNRAAEIIDKLEQRGIVSAPLAGGSKRNILVFDEIDGG
jgi:S-DNA-T family DNA segregation ATPase FtsK/SpoIIIE